MNVLSLFDGLSGAMIALDRLSIKPDNYFASEVDKYAIQVSKANWGSAITHIGDVTKVTYFEGVLYTEFGNYEISFTKGMICGGSPCFTEDMLVMTNLGYKRIIDIVPGDLVLTHKGRFKPVLRVGGDFKEIWEVKGMGNPGIATTDNHPFYTRLKSRIWDNPNRTYKRVFKDPTWKEVKNLSPNDFAGITYSDDIADQGKDENFWYLIGRYTGDGWYRKTKRKHRKNSFLYQFIICCGIKEFEVLKEKFDLFGENFNFSKERTGYKFRVCSQKLVEFVQGIGVGASNKRVHSLLYNESPDNIKAFLKGLFDSDGCYHTAQKEWRLTTTSRELSFGVQYLVTKVYNLKTCIHFAKRPDTCIIEGRTVNQKDTYVVSFKTDVRKQDNGFFEDKYAWLPIRSVSNTKIMAKVYNLEVQDDNSYTVNNFVVHNCQGFSFACKQLNFEDPRSKLFFEFVRIWKEIKAEHPDVKVFLENVVMKKEYQHVISEALGFEAVLINSALVCAQNRKRLYWTNIPFQGQPEDRGILLKDILEYEVDSKYALSQAGLNRGLTKKYSSPKFDPDKTGTLNTKNNSGQLSIDSGTTFVSVEQDNKSLTLCSTYRFNPSVKEYLIDRKKQMVKLGNVNPSSSSGMNGNVYSIEGKSPTLTTNKGEGSKIGVLQVGMADDINGRDQNRRIYSDEGKSPTLIGVTGGHHEPKVSLLQQIKSEINRECNIKILPNGDIRPHALDSRKSGIQEFGTISSLENKATTHIAAHTPKFHNGVTYRKLTTTECERLQGVPDHYTKTVSNSQAYKMLGNGWQVDTIVHLFEPLLWLDIL